MITDTSKKPKYSWLFGGNPNAIEAQEADGKEELMSSSQLPLKVNSPSGVNAADKYTEMGIKVIGQTSDDKLFIDVVLPNGWKLEPTGHAMWSNLVDSKGQEVASIFYKAAFYDRDAFINFASA